MKKVCMCFLTLVMFLTPLNSIYAKTTDNQTPQPEGIEALSTKKENFNYLEGKPGDTHLVYTYESNGSTYKVIENASENFDEVNSTIYVEDENGKFVEFATQNLTVDDSELNHITNINGVITTEKQDISPIKESVTTDKADAPLRFNTMSINGTCYGEPVGGWKYISRTDGSTRISNWTISAVTAAVVYVAAAGTTTIASGALATAAGVIAQKVVDELIPILYYSRWYYELKLQNPGRGMENFIVGSNWYTNWYENSKRNAIIRSTDAYTYHSCYRP